LSLLGGVSVLGRLGIGVFADRIGTARLFKASVLLMAVSYLLWSVASSYIWLIGFAAVLGLGYGIRIALMPAVLIDLFGVQNLGAILGIFFTASGVSAVLGPLMAGFIVDATGSYQAGIVFALAAGTLGFAAVALVRIPHDAGIQPPPRIQ
jgi:MFS family permease